MKGTNLALGLLLLFGMCVTVRAQHDTASAIEKMTMGAVQKVYAASVRIWGFDTVRKAQNSAQFSGVVVSAEGYILTVAHAVQPARTYKVLFPDGREVMAVALGRIGFPEMQTRPDMGMMKIISTGIWPMVEMGWSHQLYVDQPCFSISYPETLNLLQPTLRFGTIRSVLNEWGFAESSCKMEPGDSGGPLFDLNGKVIGLHSRCLDAEEGNYEVPINMFRKYWTALTIPENYETLPEKTDEIKASQDVAKVPGLLFSHASVVFQHVSAALKNFCLEIRSGEEQMQQSAVGAILLFKEKTYIVSKNSLVLQTPVVYFGKERLKARVVKRDKENDLILLQFEAHTMAGIPLDKVWDGTIPVQQDIGQFLISPLPGGDCRVSVIGSTCFPLPRKFSAGYLGAPANFRSGKIILSRVMTNSPAALSGLANGDQITGINGVPISQAEHYGAELIKYDPGDTISMQGVRSDTSFNLMVVLGRRPKGNHAADNFEGGKSIRSDGFKKVFSHDPILKAAECGGPVFDREGKFYGINIARFSRTTTLVMPAEVLYAFVVGAVGENE